MVLGDAQKCGDSLPLIVVADHVSILPSAGMHMIHASYLHHRPSGYMELSRLDIKFSACKSA